MQTPFISVCLRILLFRGGNKYKMAFQTALQFWKDLDLPSVQTELDKEATAIAQRQDESDVSVRKLVELTREFKRSAPEV